VVVGLVAAFDAKGQASRADRLNGKHTRGEKPIELLCDLKKIKRESKPQLGHLLDCCEWGQDGFIPSADYSTLSQACDSPSKRPLQLVSHADGASSTRRKGKYTSYIVEE